MTRVWESVHHLNYLERRLSCWLARWRRPRNYFKSTFRSWNQSVRPPQELYPVRHSSRAVYSSKMEVLRRLGRAKSITYDQSRECKYCITVIFVGVTQNWAACPSAICWYREASMRSCSELPDLRCERTEGETANISHIRKWCCIASWGVATLHISSWPGLFACDDCWCWHNEVMEQFKSPPPQPWVRIESTGEKWPLFCQAILRVIQVLGGSGFWVVAFRRPVDASRLISCAMDTWRLLFIALFAPTVSLQVNSV